VFIRKRKVEIVPRVMKKKKHSMIEKMAQFFSRSLKVIDGFDHLRKKIPAFFSIEKNEAIFILFQHKKSKIFLSFSLSLSLFLSLSVY